MNVFKDEYVGLSTDELNIGSNLDFSLIQNECCLIKGSTRFKSEFHDWFLCRTGPITLSKVKEVCSISSYNSNMFLLKSKCYPLTKKFENNATEWGKSHKNDGKSAYIKKVKNDHIDYSIFLLLLFLYYSYYISY